MALPAGQDRQGERASLREGGQHEEIGAGNSRFLHQLISSGSGAGDSPIGDESLSNQDGWPRKGYGEDP